MSSLPKSLDEASTNENLLATNQIGSEDFLKVYLPPARGQTPTLLQDNHTRHEEHLAFRLIRLVVFLCSNNLGLNSREQESELSGYVDHYLLSRPGAIDMFCNLVVSHNFYGVFNKLVGFKTPATEIFAGQALICAVEMEDERLVRTILDHDPPLDAGKPMESTGVWPATALHFAAYQQNASIVQLLLEADRGSGGYSVGEKISMLGPVTPLELIFDTFHKRPRIKARVIQILLDKSWATCEPKDIKSDLKFLAQQAINAHCPEALRLV